VSLPLALIGGNSRCGIGEAGEPLGVHMPHVVCQGCGFFLLGSGIGLRLLLRQLTRMYDDKAQGRLSDTSIAVLNLHLAAYALAMPAPGCLGLSPAGLLHRQGQGGLLAPPGFKFLPDSTGASH
jgi:hypothetical protein